MFSALSHFTLARVTLLVYDELSVEEEAMLVILKTVAMKGKSSPTEAEFSTIRERLLPSSSPSSSSYSRSDSSVSK